MMRQDTAFHGAHQHTHTSDTRVTQSGPYNRPVIGNHLEEFPEEPTRAIRGLGSVLSVPWKSASFGKDSGWFPKAEVSPVAAAGAWVGWVERLCSGVSGFVSLQLAIGRIAV